MKIGIIGSGNVGGTLGTRWAQAGTVKEALQMADLLLLATPWPATQAVLDGLGDLGGKVLFDATNPVSPNLAGLECGTNTSGAEQVAGWARGAKVATKQTVRPLVEQLGFEAVDAGPLAQARLLEPFALLWISLALVYGPGRDMGFKLLKR